MSFSQITQRSFFCTLLLISSFVHADNILTDTFLQPSKVSAEETGVIWAFKAGINEGSGEIRNDDGYRLELPRVTWQKNVADQILFKASLTWVYLDSDEETRYTLGDPSFLTTVQLWEHNSFTIGVTEPAANRPIEPDVVRFYAFYTHGIPTDFAYITAQFGPEIPDVYGGEGQNDLLSAGLSVKLNRYPSAELTLIRKFEVSSKWYDFTKAIESDLNRTNLTFSMNHRVNQRWIDNIKWYAGFQENDGFQYIFGLQLN